MGRILEKANTLISEELDRLGHPGLAPSHGAILAELYASGPLPMGVLAESIGRKKNTVTTLVRKLEEGGYVDRSQATEDARVALISLTPKGEAFRKDFDAVSLVLQSAVWGNMAEEEKQTVIMRLECLLENLK